MFLHRRPAMCSGRNGLFSLRGFFQHSRLCHIFSFCLSAVSYTHLDVYKRHVILCALSYYNAYGAVLVTVVLFISCFISKVSARTITSDGTASPVDSYHLEWRPLLQAGLFITAVFLVGAGWWFIRNAILYHGDFLGMEARNLCVAATCTPEFHPALRQTYQNQGIGVFTMIFGTDYFTPVSYTHLDVYKRQDYLYPFSSAQCS